MLVLTCLLVALAGTTPALQEDGAFREGRRLYDELEPAKAVFRFLEALRVEDRPAEERAVVYAWLGVTYAQLGEMETAAQAFDDALAHDAGATLPTEAAPKVQELFEAARQRALGAPLAGEEREPPLAKVAEVADGQPSSEAASPRDAPAIPEPDPGALAPGAGLSLAAVGAAGAGLAASAALAVGVVIGLNARAHEAAGNDPRLTQVRAKAALDDAQGAALVANLLYGAGALLAVTATTLALMAALEDG